MRADPSSQEQLLARYHIPDEAALERLEALLVVTADLVFAADEELGKVVFYELGTSTYPNIARPTPSDPTTAGSIGWGALSGYSDGPGTQLYAVPDDAYQSSVYSVDVAGYTSGAVALMLDADPTLTNVNIHDNTAWTPNFGDTPYGGGAYFRARDAEALARIYEQLDELEPVESDQEAIRPVDELFFWPLGAAFLLALAGMGVSMWHGRWLARARRSRPVAVQASRGAQT